jgi:signal transduction histidine kinase
VAVDDRQPKLANQFWPSFVSKTMFAITVSQLGVSVAIGFVLVFLGNLSIESVGFWVIMTFIVVINITLGVVFFKHTSRPTRELLGAVLQAAGETTDITPPNPNSQKNERTGLKDALQTIYELSSCDNKTGAAEQPKSATAALEGLEVANCGFVTLNNKRTITFANKIAPVHTNNKGKLELDLIFNGTDTLENWLDECSENSVHAEHIWYRIPDRLPNQENRRFFDVLASYQKDAKTETVLTLVDKTSQYIVDEENLDFIAFAAHELRGPITVIRGYLDVLEDELAPVLKDDQGELFHRLVVSSNRLSGYVNNILNTSKYDRRHLKISLAEDKVLDIYNTIKDDMQLRAVLQNRGLVVNIPGELPTVAADRASMGEVFGNLIDNAIKYSNEGGLIEVTAKTNGEFVEVSVADQGIGMPQSVVSQLFQKFYRSHRSRETVAGTGIGLYISKAIVESHGGTISVRSEEGKGSTFTVSIPIYATVADKLKAGDNSNEGLISEGKGWIKNHSMYRG